MKLLSKEPKWTNENQSVTILNFDSIDILNILMHIFP